ncbi:MAG: PEP-CTERM sorting domain-containing protein [Phycisphaerales bacterium]|nr:PEP-CTERM sorting domain-containing protein [Planctomycetota bacterium]
MMRTAITLGLFAGLAAAAQGSVVLAHYGFDNGSMSANIGSGNVTATGTASFFGGTTLGMPGSNSPPGSPSGQSGTNAVAIVGTSGGSLTFSLSTLNYTNIIFSFASQRTATGGANASVEYSLNGSSYTSLGTIIPGASSPGFAGASINVADYFFSFNAAGAANKSNVFFRISVPGASSASGNQRYDNLVVQGDSVPTPGTFALAGLGGLFAARRRRA